MSISLRNIMRWLAFFLFSFFFGGYWKKDFYTFSLAGFGSVGRKAFSRGIFIIITFFPSSRSMRAQFMTYKHMKQLAAASQQQASIQRKTSAFSRLTQPPLRIFIAVLSPHNQLFFFLLTKYPSSVSCFHTFFANALTHTHPTDLKYFHSDLFIHLTPSTPGLTAYPK